MVRLPLGLASLLFFVAVGLADADTARAFYCDGGLVDVGDSAQRVREVCGAPAESVREMRIEHIRVQDPRNPDRWITQVVQRAREVWTFELGPHRFAQQVVIDGGVVVEIREL